MARFDIELDIGTTKRIRFLPKIVDDNNNQTPEDLSGVSFQFYIRDAQRQYHYDYSDRITVDEDGYGVLTLTPSDTQVFAPQRAYFYTIHRVYLSGDIEPLLDGKILPRPSYAGSGRYGS